MPWKGNSSRRWVRGEAQSLSELALQAPEPAVGGGSGEARDFLNPDRRRFHPAGGKFPSGRDEPGADEAVLKAIVLPATRPPTTATARRRRRSVKRGQSVSGGERHPVLRFQRYFQPPTQPHGPGDVEATVASNGLTGAIDAGGQKVDSAAATGRHAPQTGGPRQLDRSSAPTGEQMDIE